MECGLTGSNARASRNGTGKGRLRIAGLLVAVWANAAFAQPGLDFAPPLETWKGTGIAAQRSEAARRPAIRPMPTVVTLEALPDATVGAQRSRARSRGAGEPTQLGFGREIAALATRALTSERTSWQATPSGSIQTAFRIEAPKAPGFRLGVLIDRLPRSAILRFYGTNDAGPLTIGGAEIMDSIQRNVDAGDASEAARMFWSPYFEADAVTLEIELPAGVSADEVEISVPRLSQFFGRAMSEPATAYSASLSCQIDVKCNSDWNTESNATAMFIATDGMGGSIQCSGTLLNTTSPAYIPYFLSANHCVPNQTWASNVEFWWFFRASMCGSSVRDNQLARSFGGAALLYATPDTDTSFMRLNQTPPGGVSYAGWSAREVAPGSSVSSVHHPSGDWQKLSSGSVTGFHDCTVLSASNLTYCAAANAVTGEYLAAVPSSGTWEHGSSGSGLYIRTNGINYLVGQLYAGNASCGSSRGPGYFGRFDRAYAASLNRWLNPSTTITLTVSTSGEGKVVSRPSGITCGSSCSAPFDPGTAVTLAASAKPGHIFSGWGGACSGTSPLCQVSLSASRSVSASFSPVGSAGTGVLGTPVDGTTVSGVGVISGYHCSSKDIDVYVDGNWAGKAGAGTRLLGTQEVCGRTDTGYSILYNFNNLSNGLHVVTVSAGGVPLDSHVVTTFQSGGQPWLAGVERLIEVPNFPRSGMTATLEWVQSYQNFLVTYVDDGTSGSPPPNVSATYNLDVSVAGGSGKIVVDDEGYCTSSCTAVVPSGKVLRLAASAAPGFVFTGWSGGCTPSGPLCSAAVTTDTSVIATFAAAPSAGTGVLGTPVDLTTVSGVGVISGYHCSSKDIDVYVDGQWAGKAGAGTRLLGTQAVCGRTDTGYSILYNFNNLSEGLHVVTASADGVPLDSHVVQTVRSGGQPWLTGVSRTVTVPDFPIAGRSAVLEWVQSYQNFLITGAR